VDKTKESGQMGCGRREEAWSNGRFLRDATLFEARRGEDDFAGGAGIGRCGCREFKSACSVRGAMAGAGRAIG
jgi:hypothetical protein